MLIAAAIIYSVLPLLGHSLSVLIQGAPPAAALRGRAAAEWRAEAEAVPCVSAVESFHCWSVSGGHVVVSLRAALEAGSDVGAARAELTAMFEAAGVASDRIAIELTTPRGGNLDFAA